MPVTEFALLHLTSPPLPDPVRTTLAAAMRLQDAWHAKAFPSLPSSAAARAFVWLAQVEDPSWLMTSAKWESVAAHWDWIRSEENQGLMGQLEGEESIVRADTVLFHVGGEVFSGASNAALLESPVISVGRMFIPRTEKGRFEAKFLEVKGILEEYAGPNLVRFGWREDVEEGAEEDEFVLVCGWESVEKHFGFAESEGFARYGEIRELLARVDLKHYKRFSLE